MLLQQSTLETMRLLTKTTAAEVGINLQMALIRRRWQKQPRSSEHEPSWSYSCRIGLQGCGWCQLVGLQYRQVQRCNVQFQDFPADLCHVFLIYISFFRGPQFEKTGFKNLALPVYFMILNFDYGIQLSIIHVSKSCLMLVTFYSSVVILRGGGQRGIEIEYPLGYTSLRGIVCFMTGTKLR